MSVSIPAQPPTADAAVAAAKQQLVQLQRSYQADVSHGQTTGAFGSLASQITALSTQAGVSVRLPAAAPVEAVAARLPTSSGKIDITA